MQIETALDCILRKILPVDPAFGPVQLMKVDLSEVFYCINLNISDIQKLGVVFPIKPGEEPHCCRPAGLTHGVEQQPADILHHY